MAAAQTLLDEYDNFVFDCDGVLWSGDLGLLPGTRSFLGELRRRGKKSLFVTNNSSKSRSEYQKKFQGLGLDVAADEIVPSSFVAARWLRGARPSLEAALVIGQAGVRDELEAVGIEAIRCEAGAAFSEATFASTTPNPRIGAVVVGADPSFDFSALAQASLCLELLPDCLFVATNGDDYDVVGQRRLPGAGCLVAAVERACGRAPDAVVGKPSPDLARYLLSDFGLEPARTLMIGDRMDTDVALGHAMGAGSLLVLTGVTTAQQAAQAVHGTPTCPSLVTSHLGALVASG